MVKGGYNVSDTEEEEKGRGAGEGRIYMLIIQVSHLGIFVVNSTHEIEAHFIK